MNPLILGLIFKLFEGFVSYAKIEDSYQILRKNVKIGIICTTSSSFTSALRDTSTLNLQPIVVIYAMLHKMTDQIKDNIRIERNNMNIWSHVVIFVAYKHGTESSLEAGFSILPHI